MFRSFFFCFGISISLVACSASNQLSKFDWSYGVGSNVDQIWTAKVEFYRNEKFIGGSRINGLGPSTSSSSISDKLYYWAGGGGVPLGGIAIPDQALVEIVSFYDRKRYRIKVDLPKNLADQMKKKYLIDGNMDERSWLYFGFAPGGYYEVLLKGNRLLVKPDVLILRGIAQEVTDDWYDKKFPIGISQYKTTIDNFNKKYGDLYKKHPIPTGMEWAPIMDAYRAKQPKTDQHPVN